MARNGQTQVTLRHWPQSNMQILHRIPNATLSEVLLNEIFSGFNDESGLHPENQANGN